MFSTHIRLTKFGPGSRALVPGFIPSLFRCHDLLKRTGTNRNGQKRTGTDQNGPERTETDLRKYRNGLLWVAKRTGTDFSGYRNGPEQTSAQTETNFNGNQKRLGGVR